MEMRAFLNELLERGTVHIEMREAPKDSDFAACQDLFESLDEAARLNSAFEPPKQILCVSEWAAARLYSACLYLVHRDADAQEVHKAMSVPCAEEQGTAAAYSADLLLKYLPDVYSLARGLAEEDPLVQELMTLARAWPLSSVGMDNVGEVDISAFIEDRALRQLYIDRIMERGDVSRADYPLVRDGIVRSVGLARDLCPKFAHLFEEQTTT